MLHETINISGEIKTQFTKGDRDTDCNVWTFKPHVDLCSDITNEWSLRGMFGATFLPGRNYKPDSTIIENLAIGQTIKLHAAILGDFTYFVSTNVSATLGGKKMTI